MRREVNDLGRHDLEKRSYERARRFAILLTLALCVYTWGCTSVGGDQKSDRDGGWAATTDSGRSALDRDGRDSGRTLEPPRPVRRSRRFGPHGEEARNHAASHARLPSVSVTLDRVPLEVALEEIARQLGLELIVDRASLDGRSVTLRLTARPGASLLADLAELFELEIERRGGLLRVGSDRVTRHSLLIYPLPAGLVMAERAPSFEALRQLSFIARRDRGANAVAPTPTSTPTRSRLEEFLEALPELVEWPEGSRWWLDRQRNILFVRGIPPALDRVEACLDELARAPVLVTIEARFVELSSADARELGVELGFPDDTRLSRRGSADPLTALAAGSGTFLGIPALVAGDEGGLNLGVLGVLSEPRFRALLRAIESRESSELLSAPSVSAVNNARATIAVTRNLPYVESYEPVFDRNLVAGDGLTTSEADVALVATINDENFTGIVLNVVPSVGAGSDRIELWIQPVVRDEVDRVVIQSGAVVQGVTTPAITRPVTETRVIDTQLSVPSGGTVALGGLRRRVRRDRTVGVPILASLPWIGALFRRETTTDETRELLIFLTARVVNPGADAH